MQNETLPHYIILLYICNFL